MTTSVWGPLVGITSVRRTIQSALELWLPPAIEAAAAAEGVDPTPDAPVTWMRLADPSAYEPDQLPAVFVTSPGLPETVRGDDGSWEDHWSIIVTAILNGQTFEDLADAVGVYLLAIDAALIQRVNTRLGGSIRKVIRGRKNLSALDASKSRTLGAGWAEFTVIVPDAINDRSGPTSVDDLTDLYTLQDPVLRLDVAAPDEPIDLP